MAKSVITNEGNPFLFVRPCGMPFLSDIRTQLKDQDFNVISNFIIDPWYEAARLQYADKWPGEDGKLQDGAEAWLHGVVTLFGTKSTVLVLEQPDNDMAQFLNRLRDFKNEFRIVRKDLRERLSMNYIINEESYTFFVDYIHSPDAGALDREWDFLKQVIKP